MNDSTILLLDLDGVLIITPPWKSNEIGEDGYSLFDKSCTHNLNELLKLKEFEVVLSSSRRKMKSLEEMNLIFQRRGIGMRISEMLPNYGDAISRKDEITRFLLEREADDYLILDDDKSLNSMREEMKSRLVLTSYLVGFNKEKLTEAIQKLN